MKKKLKNSKKAKMSKSKAQDQDKNDPLSGSLVDIIQEGGWQAIEFEFTEKKNKVISLRMSERLFSEIKKQAEVMGVDTQKFIRLSLERAIKKRVG